MINPLELYKQGIPLTKEQKAEVRSRLAFRTTNDDDLYRIVINHLRLTSPEMTRGAHKISWKYKFNKRTSVDNSKALLGADEPEIQMTATICFDNYVPIAFSGIYFSKLKDGRKVSKGIVMYVHPAYQRMGIAQLFYTIQEEKCRRLGIEHTYEIQLNGNIELSNKNGYELLSKGRLCNDGTYSQVRYLINNFAPEAFERYEKVKDLPEMQDWYCNAYYILSDCFRSIHKDLESLVPEVEQIWGW